jgi:phenylalanyl-tRNA synthetase beta chain
MYLDSGVQYRKFSRYPSVSKDISLVMEKDLPYEALQSLIEGISPYVFSVTLFDVFSGAGIDSVREKSLTFRIAFSSSEKTLTDEEINPLLNIIAETARKQFGARLR